MCGAQGFRARDLQGIRLDMTPGEVEQLTHARLSPLGRGDFKLEFNHTEFDLGFSPLGHLYRIDSDHHPPNAELYPSERASGEKGRFRYAPAALSPVNLTTPQLPPTGLLLLRLSGLVLLRP